MEEFIGFLFISSNDDIFFLSRDNLEHFKNLADAQAPKVAFTLNKSLLFMDGLRYLLWFSFFLWRKELCC